MLYCINTSCKKAENEDDQTHCAACGSSLLLKQRYKATKLLGSGGFGRTFQGLDTSDFNFGTNSCAIKQLYIPNVVGKTKEKILELFERESQWLYQLEKHPQTPRFIDYFTEKGKFYLVQELVVGKTLTEEFKARQGCYQEEEILQFLKEVALILKYIHQYKIVHRDLKPDNLMRRAEDQKWVLIDFGASRILSETALLGGATVVGTPEYMAPEQNRGQAFPASDLYSLGVICLHLLTGQSSFKMFDVLNDRWRWYDYLPDETRLSESFVKLIDALIAPSIANRIQSAYQLEQRVNRLVRRKKYGLLRAFHHQKSTLSLESNEINQAEQPTVSLASHPTRSREQFSAFNRNENTALESSSFYSHQEPDILINLEKLVNDLRWHRWEAADTETWDLIGESIGKNRHQFLFVSDLPQIPCSLLDAIDQLWLKYSDNRFGFSVQLEIYHSVNGEYHRFCDSLGWSVPFSPTFDSRFQFTSQAPRGHLPSRKKMGGSSLWKNVQVFYEKLLECELGNRE